MAKYSEEFKLSIIKQMMPPQNKAVSLLSKENGIAEQTLFKWKREAKAKGIVITDGEAQSEKWSTHDKFMIVVETASLNAAELSEYCRQKGLYVEQVESWRDACMQANGGVAEEASRLNKEGKDKDKEIKRLQKNLSEKKKLLLKPQHSSYLEKRPKPSGGTTRKNDFS